MLFVSHNMVAVQSLCRHAVLLNNGRLEFEGSAAEVVSRYLRHVERRQRAGGVAGRPTRHRVMRRSG